MFTFSIPVDVALVTSYFTALIIVFIIVKTKFSRKHLSLPPGPPPDPIIGHLRLIPPTGQDIYFASLRKKFGDVIHLQVLGRSIVILNSVQAAVELLDRRSANYSDRPNFPIYEIMGLHDTIIFAHYGNDFRMYRKMLQQSFSTSNSRAHRHIQVREARLLTQNLMLSPRRRTDLLIRYSTAIIIDIVYGHQIISDDDPYVKLAEDVCVATASSGPPGGTPVDVLPFLRYFPSWFPGAYYAGYARDTRQIVKRLYDYPLGRVVEQMAKGEAKSSFMATQLENMQRDDHEGRLTTEKLQATCATLYIAGAETTSSTLSFFFLAMVLYPECQIRAQGEIDAVIGADRLPEFDDREHLPYVECLLQETLRWNQAAPTGVPHCSLEDDVYEGMFIPKGSIMIPNTRGMTWDERIYKDAKTFDPVRYQPSPLGQGEPFPIGPFGFGRRACPGRHLANDSLWIAIVTILATIVISKEIGEDGKEVIPDATPIASGITSHPRPFACRLEARTNAIRVLLKQANSAGTEY